MKDPKLLSAITGDVIGSIYEFNPTKEYDFELLNERMEYTDDSVLTIAVADWILSDNLSEANLATLLRKWGKRYPDPMGGYGGGFQRWLHIPYATAYNSWGNGSAMRCSAAGFAAQTLEQARQLGASSAMPTHNHPEGIKGAEATAAAIFLAKSGAEKLAIKDYITTEFEYDLNHVCEEIREQYRFEPSCQETVPQSIIAFLDSDNYEDAIRLTVSLGGDADTMGAITGAIAGAYYKEIDDKIINFVLDRLPDDMKQIIISFNSKY